MNWKRQRIALHCYNFLLSLRMTDAVWVLFLLTRGFSLAQVGIAEGVYHLTSFLCEIPTGMAADLLGRRRTLAAAGAAGTISSLLMAFTGGFLGVCASMVFSALALNLISGTQEAITYDSMVVAGCAQQYPRVSARLNTISRTVSALSCLAGGWMVYLGYMPAYLISAALGCCLAASALCLREPVVTEAQRRRTEKPFAQLGARLHTHTRETLRFLRGSKRALVIILADAAIATPTYLTFMYLQRHLPDSGLPAAFLGVALLALRLAGAAGVAVGARVRVPLKTALLGCAVLGGVGTMLAGAGLWPLALVGAAAASFAEGLVQLRAEIRLNALFPSDGRATLFSVDSMAYSLLMIAVSPLTGTVGDAFGLPWALWCLGGGLLVCTLLGTAALRLWCSKENRRA